MDFSEKKCEFWEIYKYINNPNVNWNKYTFSDLYEYKPVMNNEAAVLIDTLYLIDLLKLM